MDILGTVLINFLMGFVNLVLLPYHIYNFFQIETLKEQMATLVLAGKSQNFFFMMVALVVLLVAAGIWKRRFLRRTVYSLEMFNGTLGRTAAWFTIIMMLQQVLIIAMGQIFRGNELVFAPFGMVLFDQELQWLSGQLKFYNAILIALASGYTFIEGGHVRVDLIYAAVKRRTQLWIDLIGTLVILIPGTVMLWWFAWPLATAAVFAQRPINIWSQTARWRGVKFEESGTAEFSWVWSFKILIVIFAGLMFIVAISFLLRNILALLEPEEDIPSHYSFDGAGEGGDPTATMSEEAARSVHLGRPAGYFRKVLADASGPDGETGDDSGGGASGAPPQEADAADGDQASAEKA